MRSHIVKLLVSVMLIGVVMLGTIPLALSRDEPDITVNLTAYEGNPIVGSVGAQAWENAYWWNPSVIYEQGTFHMLYLGCSRDNVCAVGYATSPDGLTWTRHDNNPVFFPDETVSPAGGVMHMKAILDGDTWVMFFVPAIYSGVFGNAVMRATAPAPTGPWTVDAEPTLPQDTSASWDNGGAFVHSVLPTDDGYVLFYSPYNSGGNIGLATSPDGIHWTKYDDSTTTDTLHKLSDPVFIRNPDAEAWDKLYIAGSAVLHNDSGWEMFYAGVSLFNDSYSVGFAVSEDGINWTRVGDAPVLVQEGGAATDSLVVVDGVYYLYYTYSINQMGNIGVATGTVTRE